MIRVILFITAPFCKRDYERYGIDVFIQNGFDVYVWDIMQAVFPDLQGHPTAVDPIEWDRLRVFKSKQDVITALKACPDQTIVIDPQGYTLNTLRIYRALSQLRIAYILTPVCGSPPIFFVRTLNNRLQTLSKIFNVKKLMNYIITRLPVSYMGVAPAAMVITEGLKCNSTRPGVTADTAMIQSHALDYDIYLRLQHTQPAVDVALLGDGKTAVFLDNFLPHHTDTLFSKTKVPVTAQMYYADLNRFFAFLEQQHHLRIMIAAHPRANYASHGKNYFGGRLIVQGKTAELVRTADLVLATFSTSLSFAALYRKPVLFITTDELNDSHDYDYGRYIQDVAELFGRHPINISTDISKTHIDYAIDETLYQAYVRDYITVDATEDLSHPQIVANAIKAYWHHHPSINRSDVTREINELI